MKSKYKTSTFFLSLILAFFLSLSVVHAATSSDLHFCEYPGTLRTMKIIGIVISMVKILVPMLIIITSMVTFTKVVLSGKTDDLKESAKTAMKKIFAGLIVFMIPDILNYVFNTIVNSDNTSKFGACETCLYKPNNCNIPDSTPSIYSD